MKYGNIIRGNWYSAFVFNFPGSIKMGENRMYVIIEMQRRIRNNRIGIPWNATPNPQLFPLMSSCCRKADPFQGPKLGSCLTIGNELSEETHMLTKQDTLLGKGIRVESSRVREPRRTALLRSSQSQVLWGWDYFSGSLWPIILIQSLSWWRTHRSAKMDASERDSGKWTDTRCLLPTFPDLFWFVVAY